MPSSLDTLANIVGLTTSVRTDFKAALLEASSIIDDLKADGSLITDLSAITPDADDLLLVGDDSDSNALAKITINDLLAAFDLTPSDYTPTIAVDSGAGTFTLPTIQYAQYVEIGNLVIFWVYVTGTITGTVNRIRASRPSTALLSIKGSGNAIDTGGFSYAGYTIASTTALAVGKYDRSAIAPGANAGVDMVGIYVKA